MAGNPKNYQLHQQADIVGAQLVVPLRSVKPNGFNYNVQPDVTFSKLIESMRTFGFVQPIIVREMDDGVYEIVNGEHRWRAAAELNMPEVPIINLGKLDDAKAKQLTIVLNELGGKPDEVRLADLLRDINESTPFDDMAKVMPFSERELAMFIQAVDFSFAHLPESDTRRNDEKSDDEAPPEAGAPTEADLAEKPDRRVSVVFRLEPVAAEQLKGRLRKIDNDLLTAIGKALDAYEAQP